MTGGVGVRGACVVPSALESTCSLIKGRGEITLASKDTPKKIKIV